MRLFIIHDEFGKLKSAGVASVELNLHASIHPRRGEFVTEVDTELFDLSDLHRDPQRIGDNFFVDRATGTLVQKIR